MCYIGLYRTVIFAHFELCVLGRQLWDRKTETKQVFSFVVWKPTRVSGFFTCYVPHPARTVKKTCFSHIALHRNHDSSPHKTPVTKFERAYAPPMSATFEGLKVSLGTWRPCHFRSEKYHPEMGQAPKSQARSRDTDHLRPSNLAARTIRLVKHTLSQVRWLPVFCEARTAGSGEVLCAKSTYFLV